jgi:hypothetical protein
MLSQEFTFMIDRLFFVVKMPKHSNFILVEAVPKLQFLEQPQLFMIVIKTTVYEARRVFYAGKFFGQGPA